MIKRLTKGALRTPWWVGDDDYNGLRVGAACLSITHFGPPFRKVDRITGLFNGANHQLGRQAEPTASLAKTRDRLRLAPSVVVRSHGFVVVRKSVICSTRKHSWGGR